jgi:gamma-glutamyl hercynylcysteine S-oxide synthase
MTPPLSALSDEALRERIAAELSGARDRTRGLTGCVDDVDLTRQHSPLMSPLVWDLAHIGNQEEMWLLRAVGGREPMHPEIDPLYDAFEHPRSERPTLPLLPPAEARSYAGEVRGRVLDLLERAPLSGEALVDRGFAFGMIAQHEQQHDETMLITHQLRNGPPVLQAPPPGADALAGPGLAGLSRPSGAEAPAGAFSLPSEVLVPGGPFTMGTSTEPWSLDNERPAHTVDVPAFFIDTTPVTNARYAEFIADGGYDNPRWWSPAGWEHRQRAGLSAPMTWRRDGGQWVRRRFGVAEPVPPAEPVLHVCWYEADAYARWAGRRLPEEAEWEKAARFDPATGRSRRYPWGDEEPEPRHANLGQRHLQPAPAGSYPDGAAPCGARQLIGDVWEWTGSDFLPYPGFAAWPYREYSEVFFGSSYKTLRGGSFAVGPVACRSTFRNWDYPIRRQIFAGFRTARDAEAR